MWLYLPIIFHLVRIVIGNYETGLLNGLGNRNVKSATDLSNAWNQLLFTGERTNKQTDPSVGVSGNGEFDNMFSDRSIGTDSNTKIVAKRREIMGSWHDLPANIKEASQEKKSPWIYWSDGKRVRLFSPSAFRAIRRPLRRPFNSWAGKRGTEYFLSNADPQAKRTKLTYNPDDRDAAADGYGVKRVPFNSWGGKRSQKSSDLEEFIRDMENGGGEDDDAMETGNDVTGWHGKHNDFDYRIPANETIRTENDYTMEQENPENDWLTSTAEKRTDCCKFKKTAFNPWGGKRSIRRMRFYRLPFFSWGG